MVGNLLDKQLIANLRKLVLDTKQVDAIGEFKSNHAGGGWHSHDYIHAQSHVFQTQNVKVNSEALLDLIEHVVERTAPMFSRGLVKKNVFVQNMWGGINDNGQYNTVHTHPNAVLSGVVHLDSGNGDQGKYFASGTRWY